MTKTLGRVLKVMGRSRVQFHLDDIVHVMRDSPGSYSWQCCMATREGTVCDGHGGKYHTQRAAEEAALEHLSLIHRGIGGERRPKKSRRDLTDRVIHTINKRNGTQ